MNPYYYYPHKAISGTYFNKVFSPKFIKVAPYRQPLVEARILANLLMINSGLVSSNGDPLNR